MSPEGVETTADERPQTHSLDQAATVTSDVWFMFHKYGSV